MTSRMPVWTQREPETSIECSIMNWPNAKKLSLSGVSRLSKLAANSMKTLRSKNYTLTWSKQLSSSTLILISLMDQGEKKISNAREIPGMPESRWPSNTMIWTSMSKTCTTKSNRCMNWVNQRTLRSSSAASCSCWRRSRTWKKQVWRIRVHKNSVTTAPIMPVSKLKISSSILFNLHNICWSLHIIWDKWIQKTAILAKSWANWIHQIS